jgi:hypothetical protein
VQKPIAILFLFITVMTTETGIQLLKIPMLVNHFTAHMSEGRSNNFTDFIKEHYSGNQHDDSDRQQDEQLPFKTVITESFYSLYVPVPSSILTQISFGHSKSQLSTLYSFNLQDHFKTIFHPPQSSQII